MKYNMTYICANCTSSLLVDLEETEEETDLYYCVECNHSSSPVMVITVEGDQDERQRQT